MRHNSWLWKSRSHPSWNHGFIFSEPVTRLDAKILVRNYWQLEKLPKGFELSAMVSAMRFSWTTKDVRDVTNTSASGTLTMILVKI